MELPFLSASTDAKKQLLLKVKQTLKEEFVGLDDIIDHIIHLMTPWYLYPQLQKRPLCINLWGMTGVGKTSLVKRLVELLSFEQQFYHFDMGNNSERVDTLKTFFKEVMSRAQSYPFILALDEFQYANTLDPKGAELQKAYSRVVWELLDAGKFQVFRDTHISTDFELLISELNYLFDKGIKVIDGYVTEGIEYYLQLKENRPKRMFEPDDDNDFDYVTIQGEKKSRKIARRKLLLIDENIVTDIYEGCFGLFAHKMEIRDKLSQMDGAQTLDFLKQVSAFIHSRREIDCTQAMIFILGNLDEAYGISGNLNPDINADEFYKRSKRITINHIKSALQQRFRNEQIGRLGNNHIIYPALNKASFRKIISNELNKLAAQALQAFGIKVTFDSSVNKVIYDEGVYPTQGTRPLFSTIQHLIEPQISLVPAMILENRLSCNDVTISITGKKIHLYFTKKGRVIYQHTEKLNLHLRSLRIAKKDELQAVTAVHECGHAVASSVLLKILPAQIFSISADISNTGLMVTDSRERMVWSKITVMQRAAVCLAGLAAEKIVFGEEYITAGSESDLRMATHLISNLVKKQGLAGGNFYVDVEAPFNSEAVFDDEYSFNEKVKVLLADAAQLAEKTLQQHKSLLVDTSQYLSRNSSMNKKQFMRFLEKHKCSQPLPSGGEHFSYRSLLMNAVSTGRDTDKLIEASFISLNKGVEKNGN